MEKERDASMPGKLILIGGYCATGKSTFAHRLGDRLKIPCFQKDTLKEAIADPIGRDYEAVLSRLSQSTFEVMLQIADRILGAGGACILESNFRKSEIERIGALLQSHASPCLSYVFVADLDVVYDRYAARQVSGERHWVHKAAGADREAFGRGQLPLGDVRIGDPRIVTDATVFADVDYGRLMGIAEGFVGS